MSYVGGQFWSVMKGVSIVSGVEVQLKIRIPSELREWIGEIAEQNHRSLTGEIAFRLQESREREDACKQQAMAG